MILPTIHNNGTSAASLLEQYEEARTAVKTAMGKVQMIDVNGRDYYPQGPDAMREAQRQHAGLIIKLSSVADELLAVMEHCQDAIDERERRARQ